MLRSAWQARTMTSLACSGAPTTQTATSLGWPALHPAGRCLCDWRAALLITVAVFDSTCFAHGKRARSWGRCRGGNGITISRLRTNHYVRISMRHTMPAEVFPHPLQPRTGSATGASAHTCARTRTRTRAHERTYAHTRTHTHTNTRARMLARMHARAHPRIRPSAHHTHQHTRTYTHDAHTHMHILARWRTHAHTHTHTYAHTRAHTHTHAHTRTRTCTCTCTCVRAHGHKHACVNKPVDRI